MKLPKELQDRIKAARKEIRRIKAQRTKDEAKASARRAKLCLKSQEILREIAEHDNKFADTLRATDAQLSGIKAPFLVEPTLSRNYTPSAIFEMLN